VARVFITVPFDRLPSANQEFVRELAASSDAEIAGDTPVLSLVASHGDVEEWKDRRRSKRHVGIPLISSDFVDAIPMISRLMKDLGVPLDWIDSHDASVIQKTLGSSESLFFVDDATEATDDQGRRIIAAQDFVSGHKIQSVFGIGGAYSSREILVAVVFTHDRFDRREAENFLPLVTLLKTKTARLLAGGRVFSS